MNKKDFHACLCIRKPYKAAPVHDKDAKKTFQETIIVS